MTGPHQVAHLVPSTFRQRAAAADETWASALPSLLAQALDRWDLHLDGEPRPGAHALVVPVTRADGTAAALRLDRPRASTRQDHLALRAWAGDGAVTLLAADPASSTQLLERLDADTDLTSLPPLEACAVVGGLLARLERAPLPRVDWLNAHLADAAAGLAAARGARTPLPRRFVEQAASLVRDLTGGDVAACLVPTALSFDNVLTGDAGRAGGRWAVVSPAAADVDPAYAVWPVLVDAWGRAHADVRWEVRCRLGAVCDAAGLDEDRARAWALVRTVWEALQHSGAGDGRGAHTMDVTDSVTLLKALQPGS